MVISAKDLKNSSSAVHVSIKKKESGGISVCAGQSQRSTLDILDTLQDKQTWSGHGGHCWNSWNSWL